jgi:hypothetical protein
MRRVANILVFAIALVLCASSSNAQQPGKVFRVGILALPPANTMQQRLGVFSEALRDLGYEEGRNLIVESRFADGVYDRLPVLAGELARLKVDVFLTPGEPVLLAAKEKGENIPIVAVTCDPLEKLLGSLRRPGGNATGFSCVSADLVGKRFSLLKSLLPRMERVAAFYNKRDNHELEFKDADAVAQSLGIGLVHFPVGSPADFESAFNRIIEEKCDIPGHMTGTSDATGCHAELARIRLSGGDELRNCCGRNRWAHHHDVGPDNNAGDRRDVTDQMEIQFVVERCVDRLCRTDHKQCVAVSGRAHDGLGGDVGTSARPVLDDEWLAEALRQPLTDQAREDVSLAASGKGDDHAYWPRRIGLRPCDARDGRQRGSARGQMQKLTARQVHGV